MRQAEEISKDIWKLAKQEISCACPFFAPLLEKIEILGQNERKSYGLDGFRMWYEPFELLNTYQEQGRKKINRMLLHSLFHLLYLHLAEKKKEETRWNLACDLVTEYTIDCLKLPYLTGDVQAQRKEIYQNFWVRFRLRWKPSGKEIVPSLHQRPAKKQARLQLRQLEILMLRKSAKSMSKNPELASLRQWIFAHNADSRGISISTAASTCQPGLLFRRALP